MKMVEQAELRVIKLAHDSLIAHVSNLMERINAGAAIEAGALALAPEHRGHKCAPLVVESAHAVEPEQFLPHRVLERRVLKAAGGRLAVIVATHNWRDLPKLLRDLRAALAASSRLRKTKYEADRSRELAKITDIFPSVATV